MTKIAGIDVPACTVAFLTESVTDQPGECVVVDVKAGVTGSRLVGPKGGSRSNHGGQESFDVEPLIGVPVVTVDTWQIDLYPLVPLTLVYVPPPAQATQTRVGGDCSGGTSGDDLPVLSASYAWRVVSVASIRVVPSFKVAAA